jgi:enamine deaminase RidA (YjgF/YER057c/UK114 family)
MSFELINPDSLGRPRGYSNGILAEPGGRLLFIAGQIAWNNDQQIVSEDFVAQFDRALENVLTVVKAAGASASDVARLVIYVTDKAEYKSRTRELGDCWRSRMGTHYPAMALVEVKGLLEDEAKVEIEAIAVVKE